MRMHMSCNGCRVLRKGCTEDCTIRPCLQWIDTPDSQANVTLFLAKFYGRAGLLNLINAAEDRHRPFIFRSLLYEACGRIVNPIYGSVGLLWSGNWQLCQAAVEAVLKGATVIQISSESTAASTPMPMPPLKAFDIRHVSRDQTQCPDLNKGMAKSTRTRFKRSGKRNIINCGDLKPKVTQPLIDVDASDRRWLDQIHAFSVATPDLWENKSGIYSVEPIVDGIATTREVGSTADACKEDNVKLELTIGRSSPSPNNANVDDTDPTRNDTRPTTVDRRIELSMSDYKRL